MDDNRAGVAADQLAGADQLVGAGLRMLAGTIVDNAGVTRTKVIPVARLRQAIESGVGLSPVFAVMCADDGITESASYGGPAGTCAWSRICPPRCWWMRPPGSAGRP
jgi:hypothetical protein